MELVSVSVNCPETKYHKYGNSRKDQHSSQEMGGGGGGGIKSLSEMNNQCQYWHIQSVSISLVEEVLMFSGLFWNDLLLNTSAVCLVESWL